LIVKRDSPQWLRRPRSERMIRDTKLEGRFEHVSTRLSCDRESRERCTARPVKCLAERGFFKAWNGLDSLIAMSGEVTCRQAALLNATGRASEGGVFDRDWRSCYFVAISDRRLDALDGSLRDVYTGEREFTYGTLPSCE